MANSVFNRDKNDVDNVSFYSAVGDESTENLNDSEISVNSVADASSDNLVFDEVGAGDGNKTNVRIDRGKTCEDFISSEMSSGHSVGWKRKREPSPNNEEANRSLEEVEESEDSLTEDGVGEQRVPVGVPKGIADKAEKDPLRDIDSDLPDTVTLLRTPDGAKVYVVGTAHFSIESQEDVAKMIRAVQPQVVLVELCKARVNILQLEEQTILEEAKNINFEKIRSTIKQNGVFNGLMYILLLSMSAHITKQLGMAPGGEFRRAFAEARQFPHCIIHLGDRPIHVTLQRALSSLSWWQTIKVTWHLLMSKGPISQEEVERCKQRDLLEEMLAEMTGEFPDLSTVFVKERDIYLTHSLQMAASIPHQGVESWRVVGVVGIGHVPGIVEHWGRVAPEDIPPLLRVPPPSRLSRLVRAGAKASLAGLVVWGCYRILPLPRVSTGVSAFKAALLHVFQ